MKTIIKSLAFCAFCLLGYFNAQAAPAQKDSIIITFGDKTRMIIYGDDRKELEKLAKYDLNSLLKDLGARLDTINGETKIYFEDLDGTKYLKDKKDSDKSYVRIDLRGIYIKDGEREVKITTRGVDINDGDDKGRRRNGTGVDTTATDGSSRSRGYDDDEDDSNDRVVRIHRVNRYRSPRQGFIVALGLNAYGQNDPGTYSKDDYDLRPFGSRYISLGYVKSASIIRGKSAGLHVDFGLDVAWNNLMFEGSNTVQKDVSSVSFPPVKNNEGREVDLRKSKLTVPYGNFSLMPTVSFANAFFTHISAGGYIGYRLGGYTKTKLPDGKRDHVRSNFYLNDLRYGAALELGIRSFPDLFVHYDMNPLFQENKGPNVRMINFGLRF